MEEILNSFQDRLLSFLPEIKMEDFKNKYDDSINKGYLIDFYEEDMDYKMIGKYHAFCVSIKKNGMSF